MIRWDRLGGTLNQTDRHRLDVALAALADGDRRAFDTVWDLTVGPAHRVAIRLLGPGPDADDAAQRALMNVFRRADEYDRERPGMPWVLGIVAWECRSTRRRWQRSREHTQPWVPELPDESVDLEAVVIERELEEALVHVLGDLRPIDRDTLLVVLEERERPGIAPSAFRKRLQRAIGRLREAWEARHGLG